jgi:hypothetical protein
VLHPRPHRKSIGALKVPILISGPIGDPHASLDKEVLAEDVGTALALGVLNPFLLAVPLVDLGTKGNPCEKALEAATVEALKRESDLHRGTKAVGAGGRWLEGLLHQRGDPK